MDAGLKRKAAATAVQRKKHRRDKSEFVSVEVGMREFKKRLAATDVNDAATVTNAVEDLTQDLKATKTRAARKIEKKTSAKKATPTNKTAAAKKTPVKRTTRRTAVKMTLAEVKAQLEQEQKERVEYRIQTLKRDTKPTAASSASVAAVPVPVAPTIASPVQETSVAAEQQTFGVNEAVSNSAQSATIDTHVSSTQMSALSAAQPSVNAAPISAELPSSPAKNEFILDDMEEDLMFAMALEEVERKLATPQKPLSSGDVTTTDTNSLTLASVQAPVTSPVPAKSSHVEPQVQMPPTQVTFTAQPQQTEVVVRAKQAEPVAVVAPEVLEEMERLKRENEILRRSNELLQAAVTTPIQSQASSVDEQSSRSLEDASYDGSNAAAASSMDTSPGNLVAKSTARYLDLARCDSDQDMKETEDDHIQELAARIQSTEHQSVHSEQQPEEIQRDSSVPPYKENSLDEHQNKLEGEDDLTTKRTEPTFELSTTVTSQEQMPASSLFDHVTSGGQDDYSPAQLIASEQENQSPEKTQSTGRFSSKETDGAVHVTSESGNGDESDASMSDPDEEEGEEENAMEIDFPPSRASTIDSGNYSEYKFHREDDFDADDDECLEDKADSKAMISEGKVEPKSTLSNPVEFEPCETMVINEPATENPGIQEISEVLQRTTAPSNTNDEEYASEDEDVVPVVNRVKRRETIALSSSSSSESESEEDETDDTSSSNVLEAALKAAGGDSGGKNRTKLSSNASDVVQKGEVTVSQNSKPAQSAASTSSLSILAKGAPKKRKTPGISSTTTKKKPSVKSSLLWPALDEFYDFLLNMTPRNVRGSEQKTVYLQRYAGEKLPAQHSSIEDYCNVQLEAIMQELVASVSNTTDRRGGGGSCPTRHLSLASVSPCGVQGASTLSVGVSLGVIFSESGFTGNTFSNNDYILTFDALGKKASSDFMSGDLILVRSPRWKNYEMSVFGVVLCDSVVAVGGKSDPGGKGGGGGSNDSDQICVLIRAQKRDRDDAVENFSVLTELCLSNQGAPNWRWSLQQVHNTTTSAREFQAIKAISFFSNDLKQVLLRGQLVPSTKTESTSKKSVASSSILSPRLLKHLHKHYNDSQVDAILGCLGEDSRVIIQGPPGTGKTKTILGLLSALLDGAGLSTLQKAKGAARIRVGASLQSARTSAVSKTVAETSIRVLVAAPSNAAVDELVVRVLSEGLFDGEKSESYRPRIVRVGRPESSQQLSSLASAREASENKKNRKKMRKYAREVEEVLLESLVTKHRSTFTTVKQARQAIIKNAQIVFCTLSGAGSVAMCEFAQDFDALIIDEAAQAVEASTLIPFKFRPHRVVLVGDHRQLPATVISKKLVSMGYDRSLQQRLVENGSPVLLLNQQYRMHPEIAEFPSTYFYGGRLVQDDNMSEWTAQDYHRDRAFKPLLFLDVQGAQSQVSGSTSLRNMSEVEAVIQLVRRLLTKFPCIDWKKRIGVIAPYKQQIYEVRGAIGKLEMEFDSRLGIEVNTVDGFQGREKEIIIYSCVRTSHGGRRKKKRQRHNEEEDDVLDAFWADERRMNVAITRAKSSLWIVGNSTLLKQSRAWRALIQHTKEHDRYISDGATLFAISTLTRMTSKAKKLA